jgi:hypothetical protein
MTMIHMVQQNDLVVVVVVVVQRAVTNKLDKSVKNALGGQAQAMADQVCAAPSHFLCN